jgi:hypothetical protein
LEWRGSQTCWERRGTWPLPGRPHCGADFYLRQGTAAAGCNPCGGGSRSSLR